MPDPTLHGNHDPCPACELRREQVDTSRIERPARKAWNFKEAPEHSAPFPAPRSLFGRLRWCGSYQRALRKPITGHATSDMIRLYGRGARQRKLAKQARNRRAE